jgi:hypothetical protein
MGVKRLNVMVNKSSDELIMNPGNQATEVTVVTLFHIILAGS